MWYVVCGVVCGMWYVYVHVHVYVYGYVYASAFCKLPVSSRAPFGAVGPSGEAFRAFQGACQNEGAEQSYSVHACVAEVGFRDADCLSCWHP